MTVIPGRAPAQPGATSAKAAGPVGATSSSLPSNSKAPERIYAHVDDLVGVNVKSELHTPLRKLLQRVDEWLKNADISYGFGRIDIALTEYMRASIAVVEILPLHKDFPELLVKGSDVHRYLVNLQKRISQQDLKYSEVKRVIKANNLRHGTQRKSDLSLSIDPSNGVSGSGGPPSLRPIQTTQNGDSSEHSSKSPARQKPAVQPKPAALHGKAVGVNGVSNPSSDLAARFAKLRAADTVSPIQDPRIRTQPIPGMEKHDHVEDLLMTTSPTSLPSRPAGPRDMPAAPTAPLKPVPANTSVPLMPKEPAAIYSPSRGTEATTINLPSSNPRGTSFSSQRQNSSSDAPFLDSPIHGDGKDYMASGRSTPDLPASVVRSRKDFKYPEQPYITAEMLVEYQRNGMRILLVDLRQREEYDAGHIMSQTIINVEHIILREQMTAEHLGECLVLSPESEQRLYEQRDLFDLIVYYNQSLKAIPTRQVNSTDNAARLFPAIVYDSVYEHLPKRRPVLLAGGLDAWVELVGASSLQAGKKRGIVKNPFSNSGVLRRQNIPRQRSISRPLTVEEEHKWDEALVNHERIKDMTTGDGFAYAKTAEDLFTRRFPPISLDSGISPVQAPSIPAYPDYQTIPINQGPARPPPTLSRHKSSGIIDKPVQAVPSSATEVTAPLIPGKPIKEKSDGGTGMENFHGKICYMISSIQALSQSPSISSLLRNFNHESMGIPRRPEETSNPPQLMVRYLGNLIGHLWSGQYDFVQPRSFTGYVAAVHGPATGQMSTCFGSRTTQHDADEFLIWLLDILEDELNPCRQRKPYSQIRRTPQEEQQLNSMSVAAVARQELAVFRSRENSLISQQIRSMDLWTTTCDVCHSDSRRTEPFSILKIPIARTLTEALHERFSIPEVIDEYVCDGPCGGRKTVARRRVTLLNLPEYLIISLNRTGSRIDPRTKDVSTHRVNTAISFEPILDVAPYYLVDPRHPSESIAAKQGVTTEYECYAVIQHSGELKAGHWWMLAKTVKGWQKFNDRSVSEARFEETQGSSTTILFFRKLHRGGLR